VPAISSPCSFRIWAGSDNASEAAKAIVRRASILCVELENLEVCNSPRPAQPSLRLSHTSKRLRDLYAVSR